MGKIALQLQDPFAKLLAVLAIDVIPAAVPLESQPRAQAGAHAVVDPTEPALRVSASVGRGFVFVPFTSNKIDAAARKHYHVSGA